MIIETLSLLTLLSAIIAIIYRQKENTLMYSLFKPLTTIIIISIGLFIYYKTSSTYSAITLVALLFSLIGDIFLISDKYFLPGLVSFLIAHICFIIGFTSLYGFNFNLTPLVFLTIIGGLYYMYLKKDLKAYAIPVLIYIVVILVMNWQAINLIISSGKEIFYSLAIASILFSFSDSILAYNKFKKPLKSAEALILSTYWIAIFTFTLVGLFIN
jgi:uncharacterized membrane protein YhhN